MMTDSRADDLKIEMHGHVAQVEICRPPHNFFDIQLIDALAITLERLDEDPACRATVLCSQGKSFCAGANFAPAASGKTGATAIGSFAIYDHAVRLFAIRKPVVAAIQGPAIGGGLGLALAADFRVASTDARFAANFVKLGTHAGFGITYTLPRAIGRQRANLLLYTGRRLTGAEAMEWGLADMLVDGQLLRQAAHDLASEIALNAPLAVVETKATMRGDFADAVRHQVAIEQDKQGRLFATEDHKEGIAAVTERRAGVFHGR